MYVYLAIEIKMGIGMAIMMVVVHEAEEGSNWQSLGFRNAISGVCVGRGVTVGAHCFRTKWGSVLPRSYPPLKVPGNDGDPCMTDFMTYINLWQVNSMFGFSLRRAGWVISHYTVRATYCHELTEVVSHQLKWQLNHLEISVILCDVVM